MTLTTAAVLTLVCNRLTHPKMRETETEKLFCRINLNRTCTEVEDTCLKYQIRIDNRIIKSDDRVQMRPALKKLLFCARLDSYLVPTAKHRLLTGSYIGFSVARAVEHLFL